MFSVPRINTNEANNYEYTNIEIRIGLSRQKKKLYFSKYILYTNRRVETEPCRRRSRSRSHLCMTTLMTEAATGLWAAANFALTCLPSCSATSGPCAYSIIDWFHCFTVCGQLHGTTEKLKEELMSVDMLKGAKTIPLAFKINKSQSIQLLFHWYRVRLYQSCGLLLSDTV